MAGRTKESRPGLRRCAAAAIAALALATAGCETDPNAPGRGVGRGGGGGAAPADVSGDWAYTVTNLTGGSLVCNITGVTLSFSQTDSLFAGSYTGGIMLCNSTVGVDTLAFGGGVVVNGVVRGDSVFFELDTPDFANAGRLSGASLSGTARMRLGDPVSGVFVDLLGTFGAARQ